MERRVIKMGDSSLVVSLPRVWVEKAKVSKGSILEVSELETGELIARPKTVELKRKEVDITDQKHLDRNIVDNYINGADVIRVSSETAITPEAMSLIYDTVRNLPGLEIIEASGKKVVIEYLGGGRMPFKKLLSRFSLIVTNQLKSLSTAFEENNAMEIETIKKIQETDKLYYTLLRNLITASTSVKASAEMELRSKDPVYFTLLVRNLWEMAKLAEKIDFYETKHSKKISYFFEKALDFHKRAMEAWKKKDRKMALDAMEELENLQKEVRIAGKELALQEDVPGKEDVSRIAKLKEIVVGPELNTVKGLFNSIRDLLQYIERNLALATLNSVE